MKNEFKPFDNDVQSKIVGPGEGLTFENGNETIIVYGDFNINKDDDVEKIEEIINLLESIKSEMSINLKNKINKDKP